MVAQRIRRQARAYTLFKLLVLIGIGAFIAYLILVERALDSLLYPEPAQLPTLTSPPPQFDAGDTVELSGSGEPGDVIRIFANEEPIGETVVRQTGRWQFSTFDLDEAGEYEIRVAPVLDSGQVRFIEDPETFSITLIDPYPSATIESAEQTGGTDQPVVALKGRGAPDSTILIMQGDQLLGVAETSPGGRWALETTLPALTLDNITLETLDAENRSVDVSPALELDVEPLPEPEAAVPTESEEASSEASEETTDAASEESADEVVETAVVEPTAAPPTPTPEPLPTATPAPAAPLTEPVLTLPEDTSPTEDGTLTIQGTAAPNSTVEILLNGEIADTVEADENGAFTTTVNLTEYGENDLVTRYVEEDGTVLSTSEPIIYTYTPELIFDLPTSTTVSTTEAITVTGSAPPNSDIQILINDEDVDIVRADETGRWSYTLSFFDAGEYTITPRLLDPEDGGVLTIGETQTVTAAPNQTGETAQSDTEETTDPDTEETTDQGTEETATDIASSEPISTVLGVAAASGQFNTLLNALETAGLTNTLSATGDFTGTVFAPTDEAFAALPPDTVAALLADEEALTSLLIHHLSAEPLTAADLTTQTEITMADGSTLPLTLEGNVLTLGGTQIITADLTAENGVIHAIDTVLIPTAADIEPPIIDESGIPTYEGPFLVVVGTATPDTRLVVMINDSFYGETTTDAEGQWMVDSIINPPGEYNIIAYTLSNEGLPLAISQTVLLVVD